MTPVSKALGTLDMEYKWWLVLLTEHWCLPLSMFRFDQLLERDRKDPN